MKRNILNPFTAIAIYFCSDIVKSLLWYLSKLGISSHRRNEEGSISEEWGRSPDSVIEVASILETSYGKVAIHTCKYGQLQSLEYDQEVMIMGE